MTTNRVYLLDKDQCGLSAFEQLGPLLLSTPEEVHAAASEREPALWIACHQQGLFLLVRVLIEMPQKPRPKTRRRCLLLLEDLPQPSAAAVRNLFDQVIAPPAFLLSKEELGEVLAYSDPGELCIGGIVDVSTKTVTLYRGDTSSLTVPWSFFVPTAGLAPDFGQFGITDYGRTISLGEYEAAFDAVLYEYDADYRRKLKRHRLKSDKSFGASLLRLRKQRKLRRTEFPGVSDRAIARIERGEVEKPHQGTLEAIATVLGVPADEIGNY